MMKRQAFRCLPFGINRTYGKINLHINQQVVIYMGKNSQTRDELQAEWINELIFLCGGFLIGAVLGSFFASGFSEDGPLNTFFQTTLSFKQFFLLHIGATILIFLSGFLRIGSLMVPLVIALEGFYIASSITCSIQQLGIKGYLPAITGWGINSILILSVQLLLGCSSARFRNSKPKRGGRRGYIYRSVDRSYWICGAAAIFLLMCLGWIHCRWMSGLSMFLAEKMK